MIEVLKQIEDKQRIVFAGAEGGAVLAEVTAHVLSFHHRNFDFISNGKRQIHPKSSIALIVSSEIPGPDGQPDFLKFNHHVGVITTIKFQPSNGFESKDEYIRQYDLFVDKTPKGGLLAYCEQDPVVSVLCNKERGDVSYIPYKSHPYLEEKGHYYLVTSYKERLPTPFKNKSDLLYVGGAKEILKKLGVTSEQFYQAISNYPVA